MTPIAVTKSTYVKLAHRARREHVTVAELIERLINQALDMEERWTRHAERSV
jgi:hypothetical protein